MTEDPAPPRRWLVELDGRVRGSLAMSRLDVTATEAGPVTTLASDILKVYGVDIVQVGWTAGERGAAAGSRFQLSG